jgi:hypothetical protein
LYILYPDTTVPLVYDRIIMGTHIDGYVI